MTRTAKLLLAASAVVAALALANPQGGYQLVAEACDEESATYQIVDPDGSPVNLPEEVSENLDCAYGVDLAPGGRFLLYPSFDADGRETLHVFDLALGGETDRATLPPAELDALGYAWSEEPIRFAFAPADRLYPQFYRVFVYQISEEGRLLPVGVYDLRLKLAESGEALAGESFYLADAYTLMWRTWREYEDEPAGPDTLQMLKLPPDRP
ncbi:hypothetical protein [Oceanithermus sp.]